MPNLKSLKLYDIDPLCYADDVSLLIVEAKKLEELKLIWSPRMRDAREPSISLDTFFSRLIAAKHTLPVKRSVVKNMYAMNNPRCSSLFDPLAVEEVTFIDGIGGTGGDAGSAFLDRTWRHSKADVMSNLKMLRIDNVSRQQVDYLRDIKGLERLYLIGPKRSVKGQNGVPDSPPSRTNSPINGSSTKSLKDDYLEILTKYHGKTLRHLLLMPQWRLSADDIALIVRQCPNLEQLGIGVDFANLTSLRLLVPFLQKLTAIRLLDNPDDRVFADKVSGLEYENMGSEKLGKLKWIQAAGLVFEVGKPELRNHGRKDSGNEVLRSRVWKRPPEAAKFVEIFGLDSFEV